MPGIMLCNCSIQEVEACFSCIVSEGQGGQQRAGEGGEKGGRKGGLNRSKSGPESSSSRGSCHQEGQRQGLQDLGIKGRAGAWEAAIGFEPKEHPSSRC